MDAYDIRKQEDKHKRRVTRHLREKLNNDVEKFLNSGGTITQLPGFGVRDMKGEIVTFGEAVKMSGVGHSDFMAGNSTGFYYGIPVPKPVGVKGKNYTYLKHEVEDFAAKVASLSKGEVA